MAALELYVNKTTITAIKLLILRSFQRKGLCNSSLKAKSTTFAVPYNGDDNNDYVDGKGFCCNDGSLEAAQARALSRAAKNNFQEGDAYETMQFYYHPDHLGSSSYITNLEDEVVQHIEYVPFGEVFVEERNNIWNYTLSFQCQGI